MVTRPQHQATPFQQMLEEKGAEVCPFPTLEIIPLTPSVLALPTADILIFTSPNAVTFALPLLSSSSIINSHSLIGAIGKKTAASLKVNNLTPTLLPQAPFNSETLLKHPDLQTTPVRHKNILIIKGQGGRGLLANQLRNRKAYVNELAVYQRKCPAPTPQRLNKLQQKKIDIITLTSSETAYNLLTLLDGQDWLTRTPLLVGSPRIQTALLTRGIHNPLIVANNPSDETMLQTLLEWSSKELEQYDR